MYIENHLTDADLQRAHDRLPVPPPPTLLAGSYLSLLEAIDIFTRELVHRLTTTLVDLTLREKVILGLYYRSIGFCRTATELKSAVHQQTLTSAERSVIELYVDLELIHRNAIPDAVEKVITFTDWQKLRAARRIARFFTDNPGLDTHPSKAAPHREFVKNDTARIEEDVERLWGKGAKPEHWSNLNLLDRSTKLDKNVELFVIKDYDRRNFAVHTGLAGVLNLNQAHFETMCAIALQIIGECVLADLHIVGKELQLDKAVPNYKDALDEINRVQVYAFADKTLQSLGEPIRYCVHVGDPPQASQASGKVDRIV